MLTPRPNSSAGVLLSLLLVACEDQTRGVSFNNELLPLLDRHCVICHLEEGPQGEFILYPAPYEHMVGVKSLQSPLALVEAGSSADSYLYHKLIGSHLSVSGSGVSMPYERDSLTEFEIDLVRQWIDEGANNN